MTSKKLRRIKKYINTETRRLKYFNFCQSYVYANLDLAVQWIVRRGKYD